MATRSSDECGALKTSLHLVFYRIRSDNLPQLRHGSTGDIENLDLAAEDALAEPTELLLMRSGLVVHLVHREGPPMSTAWSYVEQKTGVDAVMAALCMPTHSNSCPPVTMSLSCAALDR